MTSLFLLLANATRTLENTHTQLDFNLNHQLTEIDYKRVCETNRGFGSYDYNLTSSPLYNNMLINENLTVFKQINGQIPRELINDINHLTPLWRSNLEMLNLSTWQYVGGRDVFGVYPANTLGTDACAEYIPTGRPWYKSATIGKGNYILLLDTSSGKNSTQFYELKNLLISFVDSLSFYDYFIVFSYDVLAFSIEDFLIQGTDENKAAIRHWIEKMENDGLEATNIGNAINKSISILKDSEGSNCHNYMVIFSQGETTINSPHAYDVVEKLDINLTISTYLGEEEDIFPIFGGLACRTAGFNTTDLDLFRFIEHYSPRINISQPRYSEVYTDAFGLGEMTTAGVPVYHSNGTVIVVNSLDVVVNELNMSVEEINNELQKTQNCEFLANDTGDTRKCHQKNPAESEEEPGIVVYRDLFFALAIIFSIIVNVGLARYHYIKNDDNMVTAWLIGWILLIAFWTTYCEYIYHDQIEVEHYKETKEYVTAKTVRPYECTKTVGCQCRNYGGMSCNQAHDLLLSNGSLLWRQECQTGYHCCRTRTYCGLWGTYCVTSCTGGRYGSCSTSCYPVCFNWITECIQSVSQRRCEQIRGICRDVYVFTQYTIPSGTVNAIRSKGCGLNDTSCVEDHLNNYPDVGGYKNVYYNPWNPTETTEEVKYDNGALVVLSLTAIYYIVILFISLVLIIKRQNWGSFSFCRKKKTVNVASAVPLPPPVSCPPPLDSSDRLPPPDYDKVWSQSSKV